MNEGINARVQLCLTRMMLYGTSLIFVQRIIFIRLRVESVISKVVSRHPAL
jgi:hypothetical protein